MKYVFTDKKVNLPNFIHNYAEKKVGKLDRFFREDATAAITFSVEKDRLNKVEITIRSSGTIYRVSESTSDMRALFFFQINGCLAVCKNGLSRSDGQWSEIQCSLDGFLKRGFDGL